ncbi:MAG: helix-turn-helix domain-containing protein [Paraglaciecola chathamensis]
MPHDNHFQFAKSDVLKEIMLLDASMHDFSYAKHAHEEFSFGVTLSGRQDFFALGEHHKSHPGDVIMFNPGDVHDGHSGGDAPLHYKMLYIHPDQLTSMLKSVGVVHADGFRVQSAVQTNNTVKNHILRLSCLVESEGTSALAYSSALFEFAELLARQQGVDASITYRHKDPVLERARAYLHAHVCEEVSLDALSREVHMSKYHFLRRFKDYFGMTPHQYWLNYRINRVRESLQGGLPLADVVFAFGFTDLSHLNRRFKPAFGMTPYQFQRSLIHR